MMSNKTGRSRISSSRGRSSSRMNWSSSMSRWTISSSRGRSSSRMSWSSSNLVEGGSVVIVAAGEE